MENGTKNPLSISRLFQEMRINDKKQLNTTIK
jgi:hypothetical protein